MLCSNCHTDLPNNARFCLKCGQAITTSENTAPATAAAPAPCGNCGAELPAGSKFCLKCGQRVPAPEVPAPGSLSFCDCGTKLPAQAFFCPMCGKAVNMGKNHPFAGNHRPTKHPARFAIWLLVPALLLLAGWWAATSNNDYAQQIQRFATKSHDQTIAPAVFSVKARGYSCYKFAVPFGATDVAVRGEFSATGDSASELEVYVFTDDAFVNWQYGYSPSSYYNSGRVRQADINAALPSRPGTYYVVFSNNFSPRVTKAVQADVTLHYNKFWPQF